MKTPEEIRLAVLKECGRRVDANDTVIIAGDLPAWLYACNHCVMEDGKLRQFYPSSPTDKREKGYTINCLGMNLHLWSGATDQDWAFAYRLLNIEARELEERLKFTIGKLDEETWERQAAERKVMELEERAQGLVAFTEAMQTEFRDGKYGYMAKQALNQWKGGGK